MRLDGLGFLLAFALMVAYGVIVDVALFARLFKHRAGVVVGVIVALVVISLMLVLMAPPREQAGFFKGSAGGAPLVMLVLTGAIFLPFIVIAPIAQYRAMREGRRWPGWIGAWMILQVALVPGFLALEGADRYFWQRDYAVGHALGSRVTSGKLGEILQLADQRHERIWGMPWTYPWPQSTPPGAVPRASGWVAGLARSLDESELIASDEPLSDPDRFALMSLLERHLVAYAKPRINSKLLWDRLEPGNFSGQLAPAGVEDVGAVGEEVIVTLLDRLEKDTQARMCPGGQMMDADRALLHALVLKHGRRWNADKRDYEMRPEWVDYPQRVERLCRNP